MSAVSVSPVGKATMPTEKANKKANAGKGMALAKVCIDYAMKVSKEEENRAQKLRSIVESIHALTHEGHIEFRSQLSSELELITSLEKGVEATKEQTRGYSMNSFRVMVSNWRTISAACELGLDVKDKEGNQKPWPLVLGEAVNLKHSRATESGATAVPAAKRGRKTHTLLDKAKALVDKMDAKTMLLLSAYLEMKQATVKAKGPAVKQAITAAKALEKVGAALH
jgi:hypothetical protein